MTPTLLHDAGQALYGPRWQSDLARALGVSDRTVRRWAAGKMQAPPNVRDEMRSLCMARGAALKGIAIQLS